MKWIKVLNRHILLEYKGYLTLDEFYTWIISMALVAELEYIPKIEFFYSHLRKETLNSLTEKLKAKDTTLEYIWGKVMEDVNSVNKRKKRWRDEKNKQRNKSKPDEDIYRKKKHDEDEEI